MLALIFRFENSETYSLGVIFTGSSTSDAVEKSDVNHLPVTPWPTGPCDASKQRGNATVSDHSYDAMQHCACPFM